MQKMQEKVLTVVSYMACRNENLSSEVLVDSVVLDEADSSEANRRDVLFVRGSGETLV